MNQSQDHSEEVCGEKGVSTTITPKSSGEGEPAGSVDPYHGNESTYCPEDDKLRLYVGRVPREEYLELKQEGWKSTPKQDCDFVANWTPQRENTALRYAGEMGDEDQCPTDRAADRAERFSGYLDKRRAEAHGYAGDFNSVSPVHGFQNRDRAERAARRHDRLADKACTQWEKAEYWQQRTAGVISNALYKSTPSVRMGRIKKLESELRGVKRDQKKYITIYELWEKIANMKEPERANKAALYLTGRSSSWDTYKTTHTENSTNAYIRENGASLYTLASDFGVPGKELADLYFSRNKDIRGKTSRWERHLNLRLAYERQMLEAAGGRAGELDMEVGGYLGPYQIHKVNKSRATGRVVSVLLLNPKPSSYRWENIPGTDCSYVKMDVERAPKGGYRAPTEADREKVRVFRESLKKNLPKKLPLINPTVEEAKRLQEIWNKSANRRKQLESENYSSEIAEMTQKEYSEHTGNYGKCGTKYIREDGQENYVQYRGNVADGAICKVRYSTCDRNLYSAYRVVVLTDKPQKNLPVLEAAEKEVNS